MNRKYRGTMLACFTGYIVQAIVNNFITLLYVFFQQQYQLSLGQLGLLVSINFGVQLSVDFLAIFITDKIGYKPLIIAAHLFCGAGLLGLIWLPDRLSTPYAGFVLAIVLYAIGGGLIEVLVSPIIEATPSGNKAKTMSLLHSFYSWGQVGVVLLSTLFFFLGGIQNWTWICGVWAVIAFANAVLFLLVPVPALSAETDRQGLGALFKCRSFWLMFLLMICAGASEHGIAQWASAFAEDGLALSKLAGDLAGPLVFAAMMGLSRIFYGKRGDKLRLERYMLLCGVLCLGGYLSASLLPFPLLNLAGCALCGYAVGIMWPGTFSLASKTLHGGTAMFAVLALAGDVGCSFGPYVVGRVAEGFSDNLKAGLLAAAVFPALIVIILFILNYKARSSSTGQ